MSSSTLADLTRQELYDLVWSTPISKLAPRFDLSDVGLAKLCDRENIPRPPRGYWAKLEHGKKVKQPSLPPAADGAPERIRVPRPSPWQERPRRESSPFFEAEFGNLADRLRSGEIDFEVRDDLRGAHRLVRGTRSWAAKAVKESNRGYRGMYHCREDIELPHIYMDASKDTRDRALRLLDAFVRGVLGLGGSVAESQARGGHAEFELCGRLFEVRIREKRVEKPQDPPKPERRGALRYHSFLERRSTFEPTGELQFQFKGYPERTFRDGKKRMLEDQLAPALLWMLQRADADAERDAQRAEEARIRAEAQARAEAAAAERRRLEALRRADLARQDRLFRLADQWQRKQVLDSFIDEVHRRASGSPSGYMHGYYGVDDETKAWLEWARSVSAGLDPFFDGVAGVRSQVDLESSVTPPCQPAEMTGIRPPAGQAGIATLGPIGEADHVDERG